jgi:putative flavoprotein involved in K+ transport
MNTRLDTVIVGAGQAGLALSCHLDRAGRRHAVADANARVGDSWRQRWDSLTLFTPRRYDALPGRPFPGDPDGHPGKDEVADYLEDYDAAYFGLPVRLNTSVTSVRPDPAGGFEVQTSTGTLTAARVVIAGGAFHTPRVPALAAGLAPHVAQLHSSRYRRPGQLPHPDVLVVGAGNTGVQIGTGLGRPGRGPAREAAHRRPGRRRHHARSPGRNGHDVAWPRWEPAPR